MVNSYNSLSQQSGYASTVKSSTKISKESNIQNNRRLCDVGICTSVGKYTIKNDCSKFYEVSEGQECIYDV